MTDPVIFFGTDDFSLTVLTALADHGHTIALIITKPGRPKGRGLALSEPPVKRFALERGIPVLQPLRVGEEAALAAINAVPDRIGVLASYGAIIPDAILDLFDRGIINVHPSLLPKYRGPSPIETAMYDGARQTGVSLMRLVSAMDSGPIYTQQTVPLGSETSAAELYTQLAQTGAKLLLENLPAIADGSLEPLPQDDSAATYTSLLNKKDAIVDPTAMDADSIVRHIRAYELFPRTKLTIDGRESIVLRAHVGADGPLIIGCAGGSTLTIDRLIAPSGKTMTGAEFRRGYAGLDQ